MIFPQPPIFWHVSWSAPTPITKNHLFLSQKPRALGDTAAITKKVLVVSEYPEKHGAQPSLGFATISVVGQESQTASPNGPV